MADINFYSGIEITGDLSLSGTFKDSSGDVGSNGQVLSSTATGTDWVDNSSATNLGNSDLTSTDVTRTFSLPNIGFLIFEDDSTNYLFQISELGNVSWRALYIKQLSGTTEAAPIQLFEGNNGGNFISLRAPDTLAADSEYTLPTAYPGTSGFVLSSTTAGVMSWQAGGSGGTNLGSADLTSSDLARTFTLNNGVGASFSILDGDTTTLLLKCEHNVTSIYTELALVPLSTTAPSIVFFEGNAGSSSISLKAPDTLAASSTYTLPGTMATAGQILSSTAAGVTSWVDHYKNYKNTIVNHMVNLVPKNTTFSASKWYFRAAGLVTGWSADTWSKFTGTYNAASGWPTRDVAMAGVKIGSLAVQSNGVTLNASIAVKSSVFGGGDITGRVYVYQYRCSTIMGAYDDHTSVPVQEDYVAFDIPDTDSDQGECISMTFDRNVNIGIGDYYMVAVYCATSNLAANDAVWFSYTITQSESLST